MKILFVMRHSGYVRNFEWTLRALCDRGHQVHLAFQIAEPHQLLDAGDVAGQLARTYGNFSRGTIPTREDGWGFAAHDLRTRLDYLRYLTPEYRDAPRLVARAAREAPAMFVARTERGALASGPGRRVAGAALRALHRAIPTDPRIDAYLEAHAPDLLVVTPLIEPGAPQAEFLRSARALGIRTALCVASWDNLTNKGLIHGPVDLVIVWNEAMKREAVALHGVPPERVAVTGAQPFDHWFDWQPSTTRGEFCAQVGLPPGQPYILYLCSSRLIAPQEASFVQTWLRQLRESAPAPLRDAGVLIRPHPQNAAQWRDVALHEHDPVAVWPPAGQAPADTQSRSDYFDSIYHSAAVVGVNTTAEIESAIIGRGVYTITDPELRDGQAGMRHFEHLSAANGGLVHLASGFQEHFRQLDAAVRDRVADDERCRRFVETFVRPFGRDAAATPRVVDALEALAAQPAPAPAPAPRWAALVRPALGREGERLQREAVRRAEAKVVRAAAKRRNRQAAPTEEPAVPAAVKRPLRTWKDLARAYRQLDYRQKVYFGRSTLDALPGELLQSVFEHTPPERLDYPGADIYLRVTSKPARMRLRACAKEPFTIDWIHEWVKPDEVFYDIGANIGVYSLVAAKRRGGGARVFAFDPSYWNVALLTSNLLLNDLADRVTPLPVALTDTTGLSVFSLRSMDPGSARHTLGDQESDEGPPVYRQPVLTYRLDDLIDRMGLPLPNHIKLDVDGGELAVLDGAARALASPALRTLLIEVSSDLSTGITDVLARHGLRLHSKVDVQTRAGEYRVWYGLFSREVPAGVSADGPVSAVVTR